MLSRYCGRWTRTRFVSRAPDLTPDCTEGMHSATEPPGPRWGHYDLAEPTCRQSRGGWGCAPPVHRRKLPAVTRGIPSRRSSPPAPPAGPLGLGEVLPVRPTPDPRYYSPGL